ncbi:hypothetical protein AzCIB_1315 [Azoarcus sp. CIB]|uniref:cytochrome c oxidase subunit III n=1 Tax=Aromatoleum sp. (strain CIB) TaxID=198107 RepID=UPI00067A784B|nr:cytochrome c oxidase subunit III [Azoarcus sp. CIB]AKU11220.1 hypothetical protein AzCIB_1315 [Azoarcus sp. CIB]
MSDQEPDLLKEQMPGPRLAILAEALFLANLLIAPGLAFLALLVLWRRHRDSAPLVVRNHLQQTVVASIYGGAMLVGVSVGIFLLGGFDDPWSWVLGILYFVSFHATLVIFGVVGLNHAILGRSWQYPFIGPDLYE